MQRWSDDVLDSMDAVLMQHAPEVVKKFGPPPWFTSVVLQAGLTEDLKELGVQGFALRPNYKARSPYEHSRWVLVEWRDTLRVVLETHLRAVEIKKGPLALTDMPFWQVSGGIGIATRAMKVPLAVRGTHKYKAPVGSKEYYQEWRSVNGDRARAAARKYQKRLRDDAGSFRKEKSTPHPSDEPMSMIEQFAQRMGTTVQEMTEEKAKEDGQALEGAVENEYAECPRCSSALPVDSNIGGDSVAIVPKKCEWCGWPEGV